MVLAFSFGLLWFLRFGGLPVMVVIARAHADRSWVIGEL